jgi:4-hydroxybenzoate polyprenyltransferase
VSVDERAAAAGVQPAKEMQSTGVLRAAARALRPLEWIKYLFVLAPLLFGAKLDDGGAMAAAATTVVAFCAVSSAGYLLNDVLDIEFDRRHPEKRYRPIASGALPVPVALVLAVVLAALGVGLAAAVELEVAAVVVGYGVLTAAYSTVLKQLVILDVMAIAGCFLLRVIGGAVAVDVAASDWLLFCTGMLALFLGFTKRRQEAVREDRSGATTRAVLEHYPLPFLDQMVSLVTAAALLSYGIYAIDSPLVGGRMLATTPIVLYGLFRYLYLIYAREDQRDAAALVSSDRGIQGALVAWVVTVGILLYL